MKMDEKFFKGFGAFLEKEMKLGMDPEDAELIVKAHYKYIGVVLGDNRNEEGFELSLPEFVTYGVSKREGEDGSAGNYGIAITAGPELKKSLKSDADLDEDDEE